MIIFLGVLNDQRKLSEIVEMIHSAQSIHQELCLYDDKLSVCDIVNSWADMVLIYRKATY